MAISQVLAVFRNVIINDHCSPTAPGRSRSLQLKKPVGAGRIILPALLFFISAADSSGRSAIVRQHQPRDKLTLFRGMLDIVTNGLAIGAEVQKKRPFRSRACGRTAVGGARCRGCQCSGRTGSSTREVLIEKGMMHGLAVRQQDHPEITTDTRRKAV